VVANESEVTLCIGKPAVSKAKLTLYDRFHDFQHSNKGWPEHDPETPRDYTESYVSNPFATQEWC
jgi:arginine-tRNA-protein transferase